MKHYQFNDLPCKIVLPDHIPTAMKILWDGKTYGICYPGHISSGRRWSRASTHNLLCIICKTVCNGWLYRMPNILVIDLVGRVDDIFKPHSVKFV